MHGAHSQSELETSVGDDLKPRGNDPTDASPQLDN
jgi:hypothetical protein